MIQAIKNFLDFRKENLQVEEKITNLADEIKTLRNDNVEMAQQIKALNERNKKLFDELNIEKDKLD